MLVAAKKEPQQIRYFMVLENKAPEETPHLACWNFPRFRDKKRMQHK